MSDNTLKMLSREQQVRVRQLSQECLKCGKKVQEEPLVTFRALVGVRRTIGICVCVPCLVGEDALNNHPVLAARYRGAGQQMVTLKKITGSMSVSKDIVVSAIRALGDQISVVKTKDGKAVGANDAVVLMGKIKELAHEAKAAEPASEEPVDEGAGDEEPVDEEVGDEEVE